MKHHLCLFLLAVAPIAGAVEITTMTRTGLVLPETLQKHHGDLDLSSDQTTRLQQLVEEAKTKAQGLETTLKEQQQAFENAVQNLETKADAASDQLKKLLDAEAAVKQLQLSTLLAIRAELTPEQRAQALKFSATDALHQQPLEARLKEKGARLAAAFGATGVQPSDELKARGEAIMALVKDGRLDEAAKSLDKLASETGLDEPATNPEAIDFDKFDPGATDLPTLKDRYDAVEAQAKKVIHLPTLKLLIQGRDELEKAKAAEDATRVARILTWAEGVLAKK